MYVHERHEDPMSTGTKAAGIQDDYAQQIASDLSENQTAQEQVRSELQRLQEELHQLEDNSRVLLKMQEALGLPAETASSQAAHRGAKRAAVPSARRASPAGKKAAASKTAAPAKAPRARKPPVKATPTTKDTGPSWLELITTVFASHAEPKSAAEVTESVSTAHPERKVQAAVIRNTLEQAVSRGLLERSKQGRSVYYTSAVTPVAEADSTTPPQV
ncbi:hypothetical protein [Streptomyces virginiae]|uniref:hypothetical protein n=1 Tax=Streptomyces virginiae TaxID=1961 RepID=UPI00225185F6|nr:hypothetical protein [Streptomyces virginiae]MCX5174158.1 hypothetical protein [Streptomyces virginiae]